MTFDITEILEEWPYEPGQINVRVIEGDDGEPKVQMRLDLGILQMEVSGRPDGQRPYHCESLLEYFETRLDEYADGRPAPGVMDQDRPEDDGNEDGADAASADDRRGSGTAPRRRRRPDPSDDSPPSSADAGSPGSGPPSDDEPEGNESAGSGDVDFSLSPEDCRQLREEAVQYYHRYISLLVLGDYQGVLRDTTRNLRVLALCRDYAESEDDREVLEQFRPYLTMMRTRAVASQAIADGEPKAALWVIEEGLEALWKMYADAGQESDFDAAGEVLLLRGMKDELMKKLPASQKSELIKRLQEAISRENYELAAILRDELKMLKE